MNLHFTGAVLDLSVTDLDRAEAFYTTLFGHPAPLRPQPNQREWHLHRTPEIAFRLTTDPTHAGQGKLSLGVPDLAAEQARLTPHWTNLPAPTIKPNIIALLHLQDPDGNAITLWQDLMPPRHP
jgi:predicted enzyme related to lactoylglutathione lyase